MKRILVVDDNSLNLELASQLLEDHYLIATATNGEEALEAVAAFLPDLVLMDLSMPVMDGWEATRQLRADPANAGLKILALSAHAIPSEVQRAIAVGCDAVITKPIDDALLLRRIAELLGGRGGP